MNDARPLLFLALCALGLGLCADDCAGERLWGIEPGVIGTMGVGIGTSPIRSEGGRLGARFMVSTVAVDGHLLLTSEEGDTCVVKAGPELEIVGQNPLDEPVGASAAVVGGRIDIRGHKHLFAIGDAAAS